MKNSKVKNHKYELLKKTGRLYKRDILTRPITVLLMSSIATICDSISIFITFDPLLLDAWYFTLIVTITGAAILDILPSFFEYSFEKIKYSQDQFEKNLNKTILGVAVAAWFFVMTLLCVVRFSAADYILKDLIETNLNGNEYDAFTPQLTTFLKFSIMSFLNVVNIGTSATVLLANRISFTSKEERDRQKDLTIKLYLEEEKSELEAEKEMLTAIVHNNSTIAYEEERAKRAKEKADALSNVKKEEAREEFVKTLGDGDITEKVISQYR